MKKLTNILKTVSRKTKQLFNWYKSLYQGKAWYTKTGIGFLSFIVFFIIYLIAVDLNLFWLFGKSPGIFDIAKPQVAEASVIYSADGQQIGKYFNQNRTPVEYEDVNPVFWKALIDTEDERFYSHWGVDPLGLAGAVKDAATGRGGRGASTITQQLAKNMFRVRTQYSTGLFGKIPGLKIIIMKSKEWIVAIKLEVYNAITHGRTKGKHNILTMYANTVDFGSNSFGIKTACKTYFNTTPDKLTPSQAAVLVGMLKATTYYSPISHPENSLRRRNVVLQNMLEHGDIVQEDYEKYRNEPIDVSAFKVEENYDGQAQYFRNAVADYLKEWCEAEGVDLYTDGLKIYTTLDTRMQKYAEQAAKKQMKQVQQNFNNHWGIRHNQDNFITGEKPWQDERHKEIEGFIEGIAQRQPFYKALQAKYPNNPDSVQYYLNKKHIVKLFDYEKGEVEREMSSLDSIRYMVSFMHCSFIAMEPQTGHVKAWVGDIDFNHWKYDKVTAMRQPGSTFKLFVYTEAMNQGLTPCDKRRDEYFAMKVYDAQLKKEVTWAPTNANGYFTGDSMALKSAFAQSINSVAVRLGQEMGVKNIARTAYDMGIKSKLDETPSLPLGSSDVNLLELANAYCTVADNGKHHEPVLVTRILDRDGNEIYVGPTEEKQVLPYKSAFLVQQLLQGGMREPGGTSQSLWGYVGDIRDTEFGGKTGTSNNHSDAWFMGVSPKLVVGAWVGGEYRCIHFRTGALGQGSRTALPICGYFLQSVFSDKEFSHYHGKFDIPKDPDIERSMYICDSYYQHRRDTLDNDSIAVNDDDDMIELDDAGNVVNRPEAIEPKKKTIEQPVTLEDL